jgi:hypothetical protein
MDEKSKACGVFRRYGEGKDWRWIVVLDHEHKPGDVVRIAKRDGTEAQIKLGEPVPEHPYSHCYFVVSDLTPRPKPQPMVMQLPMMEVVNRWVN